MADVTLLDYLRTHLVNQSVARDPRTAGALPPVWRQPRNGTPAPGEGNAVAERGDVVIGAFTAPGIPAQVMETFFRADGIDLRIRSKTSPAGEAVEKQIRTALIGASGGSPNQQLNWSMAGLPIICSQEFRPFQLVESGEQGYEFSCNYIFFRYAA